MSNQIRDQIDKLLYSISWNSQIWEAITFKMLEGGNQVLERTLDHPAVYSDKPEGEKRICRDLESPELAEFIASAPFNLHNASLEITSLETAIETLKKEHDGKFEGFKYDISVQAGLLEDVKQDRANLRNSVAGHERYIGILEKKLSRYEKKRKKKGGKK